MVYDLSALARMDRELLDVQRRSSPLRRKQIMNGCVTGTYSNKAVYKGNWFKTQV